jgi:hypothetical protein
MELLIATVVLAGLWNWVAWRICRKFPHVPLIATVAMLSLLAFLGFFLTTVYISHGRVMSLSEGIQTLSGLVLFNFIFLSIRAKRRNRDSGS